jgi:hypothetical protein
MDKTKNVWIWDLGPDVDVSHRNNTSFLVSINEPACNR